LGLATPKGSLKPGRWVRAIHRKRPVIPELLPKAEMARTEGAVDKGARGGEAFD
jgi:hypothetical protein